MQKSPNSEVSIVSQIIIATQKKFFFVQLRNGALQIGERDRNRASGLIDLKLWWSSPTDLLVHVLSGINLQAFDAHTRRSQFVPISEREGENLPAIVHHESGHFVH